MSRKGNCYTQPGNNILNLSYGYIQKNGNNGQITAINDLLKNGRNATYTYDAQPPHWI